MRLSRSRQRRTGKRYGCPVCAASWAGRRAIDALDFALKSTSLWNESHWSNPRFDELLSLAASEYDFETRKGYFAEMQKILIEEVPTTYFTYVPNVVAHRSRLRGVVSQSGVLYEHA